MFSSVEQNMHRARAISGEQEDILVRDAEDTENFETSALTKYLQSKFKKAGYEELYIHTFYRKFTTYLFVSALLLILLSHPLKYIFIVIVPLITYIAFKQKVSSRVNNFEKDYTALLVSLASSIRSGQDPIVALCNAEKLFQSSSEVSKAIKKFKIKIEKGISEEDAILSFANDIDHSDISLFRSSFLLARKEGSSIGECLHRLAKVTRQRQSFRRKIRAAVAMQKLSAFGISGCAVVIGIIQYTSNPKAMQMAMNHPVGHKIMIAGVFLIFMGMVWMLNISKSKV